MSNELNDKIKLAIEFLNDSNVKMSSMENKVQFLKSKGLNDEEINMALSYGNFNNSVRFNNSSYGNYGFELQRDWRDYFIIGVVSSGLAYGLGTLAKKYLWPHLQPPTSSQYESDLKVLNDKYDEADKLLKNLNDDTQSIKQSLKGQQDKVNETISEIEHSIQVRIFYYIYYSLAYKLFQSVKLGEVKTRDEMNDIVKDINEIKSQLPALIQSSQQSQSQSLNELKSELKSLKSLLLSRQSSTGASNINNNGNGNISPSSSIQIGKPSIPAWQLANNNPTTNNDKDNKDHEK